MTVLNDRLLENQSSHVRATFVPRSTTEKQRDGFEAPRTSGKKLMGTKDYSLLVVDDDEMNRDMLARRLEQQGYSTVSAGGGREALDLLKARNFDLVLLDVMMPDVDGLEVLTIIRETRSVIDLPVIIVTARDQGSDVVSALQLGANDYVTKPLNFPVVLARIQTQLSIKQAKEQGVSAARTSRQEATSPKRGAGEAGAAQSQESPTWDDGSPASVRQFEHAEADEETGPTEHSRNTPVEIKSGATRMIIADYELLGLLGRGGMGIVYKAKHLRMNRIVALKVIDKDHLQHPEAVSRFYEEVEAAAKLTHPNIVIAYDAGKAGETHFLAMEYIHGKDLDKLVRQSGPLPVEEACEYIRQAALGLQHAHECGLVHRDIKPSNLIVTWPARSGDRSGQETARLSEKNPGSSKDAVVKILDMGLALLHEPAADTSPAEALTREGRVVGSTDFMAPEQWMNPQKVDIRADLYSLGCTFYFVLTGKAPFPGEEPMEKMLKHHLDEPAPLEELRPDLPAKIAAIVRRLMAKRPEQRYRTPAELIDALKNV